MSKENENQNSAPVIDHFGDISVVRHPDGRTSLLRGRDVERIVEPQPGTSLQLSSGRYWSWAAWAAVGLSVAITGWELAQERLPRWRLRMAAVLARVAPSLASDTLTNLRRHLEFVYGIRRLPASTPTHPGAQSAPRRKP